MAKFKFFKFKKNWQNWLSVGLGILFFIGAVFGISSIAKKANEDTKAISLTYAVGGLNFYGKYEETKDSIYTKDAFECQGLKITPNFDSQVSYRVFFYDANEEFIECTSVLTEFYEGAPIVAKYARLVITPQNDNNVSLFEIHKYSSDIKVQIAKDQETVLISALKNLSNSAVVLGQGTSEFASSGQYNYTFKN